MKASTDYAFFLHHENGHTYLCLECPDDETSAVDSAKQFLEEHGFSVEIKN